MEDKVINMSDVQASSISSCKINRNDKERMTDKQQTKKERNVSIDVLKCLAALLITNSHMGLPYGILIMLLVFIVVAYFTRCLERFISQTFKDSLYDWKKIVDVY